MVNPKIMKQENIIDVSDDSIMDTLADRIADKTIKKQIAHDEATRILKDIRTRKRNDNKTMKKQMEHDEDIRILKNIRTIKRNMDVNKINNNEFVKNLPVISPESIEDRCGTGKCSISNSGIIEVLMPKNSEIANCRDCGLGIPHSHASDVENCPNCGSKRNFMKSRYNPEREKLKQERKQQKKRKK